jgi:bleomycin hydrolase
MVEAPSRSSTVEEHDCSMADWEVVVSCSDDVDLEVEQTEQSPPSSKSTSTSTDEAIPDDDDDASPDDDEEVTQEQISRYREAFSKDTSARVAQNAVCNQSVQRIALSRDLVQTMGSPYFSINLDRGGMPATNQQDSGRCWLFGTLNLFRFGTRDKLKLNDFEFSESYLYFYHILEQTNSFLEFIMQTADKSTDDRLLAQFLDSPVEDGGDWQIAVNLINKYGLIPKSVYPESETSGDTEAMVLFLTDYVRSAAVRIRGIMNAGKGGASKAAAVTYKKRVMADVWRILCIHLGTPAETFDWQWRDSSGDFHRRTAMTPIAFCKEFVTVPFSTYVSLIQDPRHEYYQRFTVEASLEMLGGNETIFLNLPAEEMKSMCLALLQDDIPVWFACNVDSLIDCERGLWDANLYDFEELYGIAGETKMSKADRIRCGSPMGSHVMLFTGVDVDIDGHCRRWRVENSWGDDYGNNGYFSMNDSWFDEYVFEIVAPPRYLSEKAAAGLKTKPTILPGWDPMCSAARRRIRRRK